jgi:hypothetical protein
MDGRYLRLQRSRWWKGFEWYLSQHVHSHDTSMSHALRSLGHSFDYVSYFERNRKTESNCSCPERKAACLGLNSPGYSDNVSPTDGTEDDKRMNTQGYDKYCLHPSLSDPPDQEYKTPCIERNTCTITSFGQLRPLIGPLVYNTVFTSMGRSIAYPSRPFCIPWQIKKIKKLILVIR